MGEWCGHVVHSVALPTELAAIKQLHPMALRQINWTMVLATPLVLCPLARAMSLVKPSGRLRIRAVFTNYYDREYRYQAAAIAAGAGWSFAAILTRSARESALIFCITWPRCAFTVISLIPSSPPICLFSKPETTSAIT
jgi:hypothetical protein